ncbi:flagellar hook-length control protein FliK [Plastoroseomonas arctica]|uniref:Flagellar hook-length control protein-like C-terminal domain-containing protein n=1 Tax=Plastoroseomonas arctica TaxID=1509237 RepID=A0AAF1JYW8_9PROT|nr:flagellar hook-length control protein FliK [Plastoroseomonas arctica]MBR0657377.1 hypothetical protein [Plastoroseomonas arctica]
MESSAVAAPTSNPLPPAGPEIAPSRGGGFARYLRRAEAPPAVNDKAVAADAPAESAKDAEGSEVAGAAPDNTPPAVSGAADPAEAAAGATIPLPTVPERATAERPTEDPVPGEPAPVASTGAFPLPVAPAAPLIGMIAPAAVATAGAEPNDEQTVVASSGGAESRALAQEAAPIAPRQDASAAAAIRTAAPGAVAPVSAPGFSSTVSALEAPAAAIAPAATAEATATITAMPAPVAMASAPQAIAANTSTTAERRTATLVAAAPESGAIAPLTPAASAAPTASVTSATPPTPASASPATVPDAADAEVNPAPPAAPMPPHLVAEALPPPPPRELLRADAQTRDALVPAAATAQLAPPQAEPQPQPPAVPPAAAPPAPAEPQPTIPSAAPARQIAPLATALTYGTREGESARLSVALDPGELGRVEISVERAGGQTAIRVTAERPETLALLQRDQRELGHSLDQAGLGEAGRSISFSLSGQGGGQRQGQNSPGQHGAALPWTANADPRAAPLPEIARPRIARSLLDLAL